MQEIILRNWFIISAILISHILAGPSLSQNSGYISVNSGSIFYETAGQGPVLIMIHDGILHSATWDAQFTKFSGTHRVIRWDRRGYGKSPSPSASFSHLDDLLALMDTLKVEQATLMGCSSGGLLAIDFTLEHPERVSSLVLVGPIISGFGFSKHFRTRGGQEQPSHGTPVAEEIEYWAQKDPWIMNPKNQAAKKKLLELLKANPHNMSGSGRYARSPERPAMGLLHQIKVPTLIIAGESDIPDVHAHIGVIQAGIEGSKRVVLPHAGHLVHFEVPDVFNQVMGDFLEVKK